MLIKKKPVKIPFCINFSNVEFKKGLFITIYKNNQLRGCIGTLGQHNTIFNNLSEYTYNTAFHDTRFNPIQLNEFEQLELSISLLEDSKEVSYQDYMNNYKIGHDGIQIKKNISSAFFLPSVGEDIKKEHPEKSNNTIKIELLESLCRKAGIDSQCYKKNTTFFIYPGYKLLHF